MRGGAAPPREPGRVAPGHRESLRHSSLERSGKAEGLCRRKTERWLGLVVCLLSTRRYLTAEQIRDAVPGYPEQDDLFKRMFERDKEDLRELGVPLETGVNHPFDDDPGYRIRQQAYDCPTAVRGGRGGGLGLAARVWRRAELASAAAGALLKLRAACIDAGRPGDPWVSTSTHRCRRARQGNRAQGLGRPEPAFRAAVEGGQGPQAGDVQLPRGLAGVTRSGASLSPGAR